jgi:formyl-CoA transferase
MNADRPPLEHLRVIEVGNFMAVPFCGMQLADLGADVVKVENPKGGDLTRAAGPFVGGESANFVRLNRGKRSLAVDLKSAAGVEIFRTLAANADIVIENLRPGTMRGLGLDYDALAPASPGLIYVAATGFGQDGPYASWAGLDIIAQGMSGLMSITGEAGRAPVKVGVPIADLTCALYATIAILAALRARDRDGRGQFIDVSLLESAVSLAVWEAGNYFTTGAVPEPNGSAHQAIAPYQAVKSADGWFTFGANTHAHWERTCVLLERFDLIDDPRFATNASRVEHRSALIDQIEARTIEETTDYWLERFIAAGVPCGPIRRFDRVFSDPHLEQRGFFTQTQDERLGTQRHLGSPMRFSRTPVRITRAGPALGADTGAILHELGLSTREIAALVDDGVVVA